MARKRVSSADLIATSAQILAENNGKIEFEAWKAELNKRHETNVEQLVGQLLKKKTFILWLQGMDANNRPMLYVVDKLPTLEA